MATLRNVLDDVASFVNQDPTLVTGTDLTSQVNLIGQSQNEWGEYYQWKQLRRPFTVPFTLSSASVALPATFKKMMSPVYDVSLTAANDYEEISRSDRFLKLSTDRFVTVGGNDADGWFLTINPPMASGASYVTELQHAPSSAATLQDIMTCPSRAFLVSRTIAKILAARSDPRFPTFKAESDDILSNLMMEEAAPSGGENNQVPHYLKRINFRIGNS